MKTDSIEDDYANNRVLVDNDDDNPELLSGTFDVDLSQELVLPNEEESTDIAGNNDDAEPEIRIMKGASQQGKDLLVGCGCLYNVSRRQADFMYFFHCKAN